MIGVVAKKVLTNKFIQALLVASAVFSISCSNNSVLSEADDSCLTYFGGSSNALLEPYELTRKDQEVFVSHFVLECIKNGDKLDLADASMALASLYYFGGTLDQDKVKAIVFTRKAAELGHVPAQYIGSALQKG